MKTLLKTRITLRDAVLNAVQRLGKKARSINVVGHVRKQDGGFTMPAILDQLYALENTNEVFSDGGVYRRGPRPGETQRDLQLKAEGAPSPTLAAFFGEV